jgi:tRNA pseudouridine55 synthase
MKNDRPREDPLPRVEGLLLLDKATGMSSNHALQAAKRLLRAKKAGHAGTLDPLASGLLLVCFGKATRIAAYMLEADKTYRTTLKLGVRTSTGDAEGAVLEERAVPPTGTQELEAVLAQFKGEIQQIPPMHSALKRNGVPLYRLARQGVNVERQPRKVRVHAITLLRAVHDEIDLEVRCSKGLYVRTLGEDIGNAIGCGAHLSALRRLTIGPFPQAETSMVTLEELSVETEDQRQQHLLTPDSALQDYPALRLNERETRAFSQGQHLEKADLAQGKVLRCYSHSREFLGLAFAKTDGWLVPKLVFSAPPA